MGPIQPREPLLARQRRPRLIGYGGLHCDSLTPLLAVQLIAVPLITPCFILPASSRPTPMEFPDQLTACSFPAVRPSQSPAGLKPSVLLGSKPKYPSPADTHVSRSTDSNEL